ncbi:MAG: hypothetical protein K0S08_219 [Gammaproteobacteria bacterium]|jgi:hypothetical protein|nr:hypothetical protein [Gammaproteobacteria bacterium]
MPHPDSIENKKLSVEQLKRLNSLLALSATDAYNAITELTNSDIIDFSTDFPNDSSETRELKARFRKYCEAKALQPYWQECLSRFEFKTSAKTPSAYLLLVGIHISINAYKFLTQKEFELFLQWSEIGLKQYHALDTYANLIGFLISQCYEFTLTEKQNFCETIEKLRLEMLVYYSEFDRCQAINLSVLGHFATLNLLNHQPIKAYLNVVEIQESLQKIEDDFVLITDTSTKTNDAQKSPHPIFSLQKFNTDISIFWNKQTTEEVKKDLQEIAESAAREATRASLCRSA